MEPTAEAEEGLGLENHTIALAKAVSAADPADLSSAQRQCGLRTVAVSARYLRAKWRHLPRHALCSADSVQPPLYAAVQLQPQQRQQ